MSRRLRTAVVAALAAACARSAPPPPPSTPRPTWGGAGQPLVRSVDQFPPTFREPAQQGFWTRFWNAVVGLSEGQDDGPRLARPFGVAVVGPLLWVADPDARAVLQIDRRTGSLGQISCPGRDWQMPMGLAAAPDGTFWVADAGAHAVVHVAGEACSAFGQRSLSRPSGVAVAAGRVYAVDPPGHRVIGFAPDGTEQVRIGGRGEKGGELNYPTGIAALADGTLLVVDALNFRVERFTSEGRWLGSFGEPGDGEGALGRPKAIATDEQGRIYVTDALHDVVVVYSPTGAFQLAFGGSGQGAGSLTLPAGLAFGEGRLFVADSFNRRIGIYEVLGGTR